MSRIIVSGFIWLALAGAAVAQSPTQAIDPGRQRHLELASRYLELTQGGDALKPLRGQIEQTYGEMPPTEDQRGWMTEQLASTIETVVAAAITELSDEVADAFTIEELEGAISFYASPLGRAVVLKQSGLNFEMQQVVMPLLAQRLTELMTKYCLRFDCTAGSGPASKSQP